LARFNRHHVNDTIVFMGSARLLPRDKAEVAVAAAEKSGEGVEKARMALELSFYYEAARELSHRLTTWSKKIEKQEHRFVVCTGGGPGIMEAANRGAFEINAPSIGFNITLPKEQEPNPYTTPELTFQFHYFAMRKMHFAMRANALVVFPGGFGTLDELFEILTLLQTAKAPRLPIVLVNKDYWSSVIDFDMLCEEEMILRSDCDLFHYADNAEEAWAVIAAHGLRANLPDSGRAR
jgi:uncharacterized protein (TIGR00730 family)